MLPRIKENPGFVAVTTETKILIAVEISHLDIDHEFKCNFMSLCVPQFVSLSCVVSLQSIVNSNCSALPIILDFFNSCGTKLRIWKKAITKADRML